MKGIHARYGQAVILALIFITTPIHAQTNYGVVDRGADYKELQRTEVVNGTNRVHKYTELATGMNYTNASGQWIETREQISLLPTGGAAATQGRHKVYFPADIYNGVLEVVTPDGRHLKSRPLGVSYDDGSNTVFIATLKNTQGYLTSSNQVTYRDAFTEFKADLVCTYRRSGFECDLVFRQQPPTPEAFGLDRDSSTLQMITEFFNTQDPEQIPATSDEWYGLQDSTLKFGKLTMKQGKAFAIKTTNSLPSTINSSAPVYKRWLHLDNRTFLIEELPLEYLADDLSALPLTASVQKPGAGSQMAAAGSPPSGLRSRSSALRLPPAHDITTDTNQILLASADMNRQPGVVLDYNEISTDQTDFTFENGTTYLIAGQLNLEGTTTIEGGTIIKYDTISQFGSGSDPWTLGGPTINILGGLVCNTDPYHPAILTVEYDNFVGETITPGSTPFTGDGLFLNLDSASCSYIHDLRISYANVGLTVPCDYDDFLVKNCQFINCYIGILNNFEDPNGYDYNLVNVLFGGCHFAIVASVPTCDGFWLNNVTADVASFWDANFYTLPVNAVNSIIKGDIGDDANWSADHTVINSSGTIFETNGNNKYYLATNSPYRNTGTTAINPDLLAELQTMTTYAPQDGGYPDNDGQPDLGYHYPVNEDSDHDGLPDWWEWKYFGDYSHNGSDIGVNGLRLQDSYLNGLNPNLPINSATSLTFSNGLNLFFSEPKPATYIP